MDVKQPKPCPFCGGEPKIIRRAGAFGVKCTCEGKRFVHSYGKTEEAAIFSWDMRYFKVPASALSALAAKDAELSRLRGALDQCEDYFDNRADADYDQDGFIPNKEMVLLHVVRTALNESREGE